jgi:hypothetical protein
VLLQTTWRKKEKAIKIALDGLCIIPATTYSPMHLSRTVQSAQQGLTSVFGMGTGVSPAVRSPETCTRLWREQSTLAIGIQWNAFATASANCKKIMTMMT